jgi:hypothetical protein
MEKKLFILVLALFILVLEKYRYENTTEHTLN